MKPGDDGLTRRGLFAASGGALAARIGLSAIGSALAPTKAHAAEIGTMKIRDVESFPIKIPVKASEAKAGVSHRFNVVRVTTASGVRGYSFTGPTQDGAFAASRGALGQEAAVEASLAKQRQPDQAAAFERVRKALIGSDLFAVEQHLKVGLGSFAQLEEAMWDAIGKVSNQPVHRLLGGAKALSIPVSLAYAWPGETDQPRVLAREQGRQAERLRRAGFKAMKIPMLRAQFIHDAEACQEILAAGGRGFKVMADRSAAPSGHTWDYDTALAAAKALEKAGVYWLEGPFAGDDCKSSARLRQETEKILIAGGKGFSSLDAYRQCLMHRSFDIVQPDLRRAGGVLNTRKVAILSEAFNVPLVQHGTDHGLPSAGRLQVAAAVGTPMFEFQSAVPPLTPQEQWMPLLKILNQKEVFTFSDGEVQVPERPGLGFDLNEAAIDACRV